AVVSFYGQNLPPKIWYGNGLGAFESAAAVPLPNASFAILRMDANEDGLPDLAAFGESIGFLSLHLAPRVFAGSSSFPLGANNNVGGAHVADLDADGHQDLVLPPGYDAISVVRGDGLGGFASPLVFGAWDHVDDLAVGDLNEDGKPDLVTASRKGESYAWPIARLAVMLSGASSAGPWTDLGAGLAGSIGVRQLTGAGTLQPSSPVTLTLGGARPGGIATLVAGPAAIGAPFKGGIMVPQPLLLIFGLPVGADGVFSGGGTWYGNLPPGLSVWFQAWIADPAGPKGFAASNGLSGTTP